MNVPELWRALFRRPTPAQALAATLNSAPSPAFPTSTASILMPAPQEHAIQMYRHGGRLFERLSPERQEQAQRELYLHLKAAQMAGPQYEGSEDRWTELDL